MTQTRLNTRAASRALKLKCSGLVGLTGPTRTLTSDDGKWSVTFPADWFPSVEPGAYAVVTLGVVQTLIEEIPPDFLQPNLPLIGKAN